MVGVRRLVAGVWVCWRIPLMICCRSVPGHWTTHITARTSAHFGVCKANLVQRLCNAAASVPLAVRGQPWPSPSLFIAYPTLARPVCPAAAARALLTVSAVEAACGRWVPWCKQQALVVPTAPRLQHYTHDHNASLAFIVSALPPCWSPPTPPPPQARGRGTAGAPGGAGPHRDPRWVAVPWHSYCIETRTGTTQLSVSHKAPITLYRCNHTARIQLRRILPTHTPHVEQRSARQDPSASLSCTPPSSRLRLPRVVPTPPRSTASPPPHHRPAPTTPPHPIHARRLRPPRHGVLPPRRRDGPPGLRPATRSRGTGESTSFPSPPPPTLHLHVHLNPD